MYILAIRTDQPQASLALYQDDRLMDDYAWQAHRILSETIHQKIKALLVAHDVALTALGGIVVFKGPGSFTGLRIGIATANALAYGLSIPIVSTMGDDWAIQGVARVMAGQNEQVALPEYGALPHITQPKK